MTDIIVSKKEGVRIVKKDCLWCVKVKNGIFTFDNLATCVEFAVYCATERKDLSFP